MPVVGWRLHASLPAAGKIFKLPNICGNNRTKWFFSINLRFMSSSSSSPSSATERGRATGWDSAASRTTRNTSVRGRWIAHTPWTPEVAPVSRNPGCPGRRPSKDSDGETRSSAPFFFFSLLLSDSRWGWAVGKGFRLQPFDESRSKRAELSAATFVSKQTNSSESALREPLLVTWPFLLANRLGLFLLSFTSHWISTPYWAYFN